MAERWQIRQAIDGVTLAGVILRYWYLWSSVASPAKRDRSCNDTELAD